MLRCLFERFGENKIFTYFGKKILAVEAVQIFYNPIIRQDREIFRRKNTGDNEIIFLVTRVIWVSGPPGVPREFCTLGTVMTIGDIDRRQFAKSRDPRLGLGDPPNLLPDALGTGEAI